MVERFTIDWEYDHGTPRLVRISTPTGPFVQHSDYASLEAEVSRLTALVDEAKGMARPFAARAGLLDGKWLDHETHWSPAYGSTEITIGDLRAARAFAEKAGA